MEWDIATGDHNYTMIKAYQILELLSKSDLWKEKCPTFLFCVNVAGVGTGYDLLLEFIHKNVNITLGVASPSVTLSARLNRISTTLPTVMRAKTARQTRKTAVSYDNEVNLSEEKILWPKPIDTVKALELAKVFIDKGLFEKDEG